MTMRNTGTFGVVALTAFTAALVAFASGCTVPNTAEIATLDQPAVITTRGARPESQVDVHQQGLLDPVGRDLTLRVNDTQISLRTDEAVKTALVSALTISLGDLDIPASEAMPQGVKLREQRLSTPDPRRAKVVAKSADSLTLQVQGRLKYDTKMVLSDGTLYPLGSSYTEISDLDFTIRRNPATGEVTVTLDATPNDTCAAIGDIMTLSKCALYVQADAQIASLQ
jgi:hypothetical protein